MLKLANVLFPGHTLLPGGGGKAASYGLLVYLMVEGRERPLCPPDSRLQDIYYYCSLDDPSLAPVHPDW